MNKAEVGALTKVAEELNKVLALDPAIDVEQDADDLLKEVLSVFEEDVKEGDVFSDETVNWIAKQKGVDAPRAKHIEQLKKEKEESVATKKEKPVAKGKSTKEKPAKEKAIKEKAIKEKAIKEKAIKEKAIKEKEPSNKMVAYQLWKAAKDKTPHLVAALILEKGIPVKSGTANSWASAWNKEKNLPAGA